ncbi:uncharacterized protein LOC134805521 [Cydia splendana]|uniref:uncharacterized protein LOC134805521 n=1 Tax=Cydia splendana TaxID=1100963 RepID=UPI00300CFC2E
MSICDEPRQGEFEYSTINQSDMDTNTSAKTNHSTELSLDALSRLLDIKLAGVKSDIRMLDSKLSTAKAEIFNEINKKFTIAIDSLKKEFTDTTDFLSDQIKDVRTDLVTMNNKIQMLESENTRLSAELLVAKKDSKQQSNTAELKTVIDQMHMELNERDQALILNDLEISGVPEHPGESTLHIVQAISSKIGISLDDREVVSVERVGPLRPSNVSQYNARQHPRPLVLRLARRSVRDNLIQNARVRRSLDTSNIGLPEHTPSRVYINERLTKTNRKLFWQARQAGNTAGWRFVWTKEGCIFAKRTDGKDSKTIRIRSDKEVGQVFGVDPAASIDK